MRQCGDCTLCCKLVGVEELNKPQNVWCQYCNNGTCNIYQLRPKSCRDFDCLWLQGLIPEDFKPNKIHLVFAMTTDGKRLVLHKDPTWPDTYKEGPVGEYIEGVAQAGVDVIVIEGDKRHLLSYNPETLNSLNISMEVK